MEKDSSSPYSHSQTFEGSITDVNLWAQYKTEQEQIRWINKRNRRKEGKGGKKM